MGIASLTPSTTPQQSSRGFVAPTSVPVKKTPSITDIIGESNTQNEVNDERREVSDNREEVPIVEVQHVAPMEQEKESNEVEEKSPSNFEETPEKQGSLYEHWQSMFQQVFASVPTIYFSLKETLPQIENNIIQVTVKNDIQKEHFEAKTREVLEYLRTHYDEKIEDIVVVTNEKLETKKIIYDVKDKLQNFKEQNEEFEDFLQILDLKIKD